MNENKNVAKKRAINERLKITVIGCGACGNGITAEIQEDIFALEGDKSNVSFIGINTSKEDLDCVNLDHKLHLNNSKGQPATENMVFRTWQKALKPFCRNCRNILLKSQLYLLQPH